jgi:hypothetical protein
MDWKLKDREKEAVLFAVEEDADLHDGILQLKFQVADAGRSARGQATQSTGLLRQKYD